MRKRVIVQVWEPSVRRKLVDHLERYLGECIDFVESPSHDQTKKLQRYATEPVLEYPGKDFNAAVVSVAKELLGVY